MLASVLRTNGLSSTGKASTGGYVRSVLSSLKLFNCSSVNVNSSFSDFLRFLLSGVPTDARSLKNLLYTLQSHMKDRSWVWASGGVIF